MATDENRYVHANELDVPLKSAYRPLHLYIAWRLLSCVSRMIYCAVLMTEKQWHWCYLTMSTAFDTVDHNILMQRLEHVIGLKWLVLAWSDPASLTGHSMCQYTKLVPLLFVMYTHPIGKIAWKHHIGIHMYADDIQLYVTFDICDETNRRCNWLIALLRSGHG